MKRILIGTLVLVLCLGVNSCKKDSFHARSAEEKAAYNAALEKCDLALKQFSDLVAKAKTEGDKWSVDEWKEAYESVMLIYGYDTDYNVIKQIVDENRDKAIDDMELYKRQLIELEPFHDKWDDIEKLTKEFEDIAYSCENGKTVFEDAGKLIE